MARQDIQQRLAADTRRGSLPPRTDTNSRSRRDVDAVDGKAKPVLASVEATVQTHRVQRGETLRHVAARYDTPEASLIALNGLSGDESIRSGQILFVPSRDKLPTPRAAPSGAAWRRYAKPPKEKGTIDVATSTARFVGPVLAKEGHLRPAAVRTLNDMLGAGGKHPPLPARLIQLLVKVSDTFGGRPIRVVSGYRTNSYYQDSRHRLSAAIDFTIVDVPNVVLCEYLRELEDVGVGYYPNSTFVHLDVRNQTTYWVDYAGPGEPPRSTPNAPRAPRGSKRWLMAELDALVNHTKKALEPAKSEASPELPESTLPALEVPAVEGEQVPSQEDAEPVPGDANQLVAL